MWPRCRRLRWICLLSTYKPRKYTFIIYILTPGEKLGCTRCWFVPAGTICNVCYLLSYHNWFVIDILLIICFQYVMFKDRVFSETHNNSTFNIYIFSAIPLLFCGARLCWSRIVPLPTPRRTKSCCCDWHCWCLWLLFFFFCKFGFKFYSVPSIIT